MIICSVLIFLLSAQIPYYFILSALKKPFESLAMRVEQYPRSEFDKVNETKFLNNGLASRILNLKLK